ncbi:MAG TPA: hypothetical protein PK711_12520 [Bacteroidales bacterium]|nr:hypothetical protein [Bacteroidales bacterium]HRZ20136.1 hypothetical protein [Bacteroidales bacterium]
MEFNIEPYKGQTKIIRETAEQVIRDFGRFGIDITFSGNTQMAYTELFHQLDMHIANLIENDFGRLYALLYQIDLSESSILTKKREFPTHTDSEILTELILHRELKKVLTRNYFRKQKDQHSSGPI